MWPKSVLTERLGLEWPIIQAPMAGASTPELAAAVSNAGGLGSLGLATVSPGEGGAQIEAFGELSGRPLNANYFCHEEPSDVEGTAREMRARLQRRYFEAGLGEVPPPSLPFTTFGWEHVEQIRKHRPQVVSFHFGLPDDSLLHAVKDTGALVFSSATTVAEARWLEERSVDAVIAQGLEAGGHRGTFQGSDPTAQPGLFALLPQIAAAVNVPVIAAGGIVDGRTIAAALVLGASAVQIGTAFLRCPETRVHPRHREALAAATDASTRVTRLFSGKPARSLVNRYLEEFEAAEDLTAPFPAQLALWAPLMQAAPEAEVSEVMTLWSGQSAALTREMSAADLVRTLVAEAEEVAGRL
jgi:nitronate monooxygenase